VTGLGVLTCGNQATMDGPWDILFHFYGIEELNFINRRRVRSETWYAPMAPIGVHTKNLTQLAGFAQPYLEGDRTLNVLSGMAMSAMAKTSLENTSSRNIRCQ
jgi:hypothetical protein